MATFVPIRNIPPTFEFNCATNAVIPKGCPVLVTDTTTGLVTIANDTTYADIIAVSAEAVSSPADGKVLCHPLLPDAIFAYYTGSHNASSVCNVYKTTCLTNAVTLQTTVQVTTACGFRILEYDANTTTAKGVFVNAGFSADQ